MEFGQAILGCLYIYMPTKRLLQYSSLILQFAVTLVRTLIDMASEEIGVENATPMNGLPHGSHNEQEERQEPAGKSLAILCSGKARCGKSNALNNLFGLNFPSRYSSSSVTRNVDTRRLANGNDTLIVVDTPGLRARDIPTGQVVREIFSTIGGLDYALIYCYSVNADNAICEDEMQIVKNLQKSLGKNVWEKCVVLLTFSDQLRSGECPEKEDREKYKDHLREHVRKFSEMLREQCGSHVPRVKTIFDVTEQENTAGIIVAIPVGRKQIIDQEEHLLIPDIQGGENWGKKAFDEILQKTTALLRRKFSAAQGGKAAGVGLGGGIAGAVAGGVIGGVAAGLPTGGLGIVPGVVIGAIAGGAAGGLAGTTGSLSVSVIGNKDKNNKINKLEDAELVSVQNRPPANSDTPQVNSEAQ